MAVILEWRWNDWKPEFRLPGQVIHMIAMNRRRERDASGLAIGDEIAQCRWIEHGPGEDVRSCFTRLFEHRDR
jgi:hypothetical protein